MDPVTGTEVIVRELLMPKLHESYEQLRAAVAGADLLVTHPIAYAAPVLAERLGLPWASTVLAPTSFLSAYDLPLMSHAPSLRHARKLGLWATRAVIALVRRATDVWSEPVQRLRAEVGLARGRNAMLEGQFSPRLTLALYSRLLGSPQPDWPPHARTTGFVFYNGRDTLEPKLEAFLAAGPAPVVFTLGTSAVGAAGRFYHESAAAAAQLGVRAVLLTGGLPQNVPDRALSPDMLLVDRATHQLLFPRASAVVNQGGAGTLGQALRSGHPMIVVPHSHDQPDNAARAAKLGVARVVSPKHYRAARVARELEALTRGDYRKLATEVAAAVRAEGGAADAAAALEQLLH